MLNEKEFATLLESALGGSYSAQASLKEAITTSDLPRLFARVASAELEQQYPDITPVWQEFASSVDLPDFRPSAFYELLPDSSAMHRENGGVTAPAGTLPRVPELTPYPTFEFRSGEKFVRTAKHGARIHFSFEAFINDEWNQIADLPSHGALLARNTEDALVTSMLVNTGGLNTQNFNAATGNILLTRASSIGDVTQPGTTVPDNAPLSLDALYAALAQAGEATVNGNPVIINEYVLLVPPGLQQYANLLVNASVVRQEVGGRTYEISNSLPSHVRVVVNPWLQTIAGTAASTMWFLLPAGGRSANGRRSIVKTGLMGRPTPEFRVSNTTGIYLGGGDVPYTEGSFDNDDAEMRVRHLAGAGFVGGEGTVASLGDSSSV